MIHLSIHLEGDNCWPDLAEKNFEEANFTSVAALPNGTVSGKPTISLRIETQSGEIFVAQTTLALFLAAADAFKARYGDPR